MENKKSTAGRLMFLAIVVFAGAVGWSAASVNAQEPTNTALLTSILQQLVRIDQDLACLCPDG